MLVQRGTLHVGDAIVAGDAHGKVRGLLNYRGEKIKEARPGDPVEIIGFDKPPVAGELARVVENDRQARHLANIRGERLRREQLAQRSKQSVSLDRLFEQLQEGAVQDLNLVVKADVQGSVEAAVSELAEDHAHRGARERDPHRRRRDLRERHHARLRLERDGRRLQRPPERRGARARRARGRRDPHLPRHLQAHRGHRAGARRDALRRQDRGDDRRGRGAGAVQGLAARHDRRLLRHPRRREAATRRSASSATAP